MIVQIAIALCVDLQIPSMVADENDSAKKAELERTYLGVWYITCPLGRMSWQRHIIQDAL